MSECDAPSRRLAPPEWGAMEGLPSYYDQEESFKTGSTLLLDAVLDERERLGGVLIVKGVR